MSKVQMLKLFISEQVTTAVEKIFDKFLTTIEDYEKELSRSREENERRRKLLEALSNPQLQLHGTDGGGVSQLITAQGGRHGVILPETQQPLDRKEDVPSVQEGKSSSPDQQDPEPPHIKEEQQELGTNQEGEKLQELVIVDISSSHVPVKNQRQSEENREAEPPVNILIEEFETESDGEDCGGLEPLMDFHPDRHLQPDTDEKTLVSVQSSSLTSVSEIREPQSDINSLETKEIVVSDVKFNTDNNSFICSQCGEKFASEESLQGHMTFTHQTDHMGVHAGETELSCQVCGQRFALHIQLRRHKCVDKSSQLNGGGTKRKSRRGEATNACNSFSCPKCNKSFDDICSLEKHLRSHKKEKCISCPFCGKSFVRKAQMMTHIRVHTGEKPFSCRYCYEMFMWSTQVKTHKCSREKCLKLYQRPIEEDREAELLGLQEADVTQSTVTPVPVKNEDDEETPQSSQLHPSQTEENMEAETPASISTEQMKREDDGEDYAGLEPYSDTHLQSDTKDKISNSSETDVGDDEWTEPRGTQSDSSQIHSFCNKLRRRKTERPFRPFSCSKCNNAFDSFRALQKHKLIHSTKNPITCPICCRTVPTMSHLTHHIVTHTGEKPLGCRRCYKRFGWPSQVKSHKCSREKYLKHNKSPLQRKKEAELQGKSEDDEETPQSSQFHPSQIEENREAETPASISTEQMEPETDGEDCRGSEPDPDRHLQPVTDDTPPEYGMDDADRMMIPFSCSICGQDLSSKTALQKHTLLHFKRKIFNCSHCDKTFSCYTEFLTHKNDEHPELELEAGSISTEEMEREDDGGDDGGSEPYFDPHLQPDTADTTPEYGRDDDDRMMIREPQTDLNCQKSNEGNLKPFSCSICEKKLSSETSLQSHTLLHFKTKIFNCGHCEKTFSCYTEFLTHKNHQHPEPELELEAGSISTEQMKREDGGEDYAGLEPYSDTLFQPDNEDKISNSSETDVSDGEWTETRGSQSDLKSLKTEAIHVRDIKSNTDNNSYACCLCGKKFANEQNRQIHMTAIHKGINTFNCPLCVKAFKKERSMHVHMAVHAGMKQFRCRHCEKIFKLFGGLKRHRCVQKSSQQKREARKPASDAVCYKLTPKKTKRPFRLFSCKNCDNSFDNFRALVRHRKIHSKKPIICPICGKTISTMTHLRHHIRTHTGEKPFSCSHCYKMFTWPSQVKNHKCKHEKYYEHYKSPLQRKREAEIQGLDEADVTPFPVESEDDEETSQSLQLHPSETEKNREAETPATISTEQMEPETDGEDCGGSEPDPDGRLKPDTADTTPEYGRDDNDWMKIREPQTDLNCQKSNEGKLKLVYRCFICELKLSSRRTLKKHMKRHFMKNTFNCGHCDKTFSCYDEFTRHMNDEYPELELEIGSDEVLTGKVEDVKEFICPDCGKTFSSQTTLDWHMEVIKRKTYSCQFCSAIFCNNTDYIQHKKFHRAQKPFKCPECDKDFGYLSSLKTHMVCHSTERLCDCPLCTRKFKDYGSVRQHLRVHLPDKRPYICPFCKRAHNTRKRWLLHMKTYIGQKPADLKSE